MDVLPAIVLVLAMLVLLYLAIRFSRYLSRQAICQVVSTFRDRDAVKPENAITLRDIGISVWSPFIGINGVLRDYRPWALQTLVQAGVVRSAGDKTYYLSEDTLDSSHLDASCQWKKKDTQILADAARAAKSDDRK
jgi:hypothetical protein